MHFSIASALAAALCIVSASARLTSDQQNAIDIQNSGRMSKGLPFLTWDDTLEGTAQQCANKIAQSGDFAHCQAGENLYAQWGSSAPPFAAGAQAWMNEASNYHGEVIPQGNFESYGHYSELPGLRAHPRLWFRLLTECQPSACGRTPTRSAWPWPWDPMAGPTSWLTTAQWVICKSSSLRDISTRRG